MKQLSKSITSEQSGPHEDLPALISRYQRHPYRREISSEVDKLFKDQLLPRIGNRPLILDSCCGVGESTFHLAHENPDCFILGVDKSEDRIDRKNDFKQSWPDNASLLKGNILDFWLYIAANLERFSFRKMYMLYPNPYPKTSQLKKRWHAHPVALKFFSFPCEIEMRTNWQILAEEFALTASLLGRQVEPVLPFEPEGFLTPFERKYYQSDQNLYRVLVGL